MQNLRDKLLKAGWGSQTRIPKLPALPGSKAHQREEAAKQREMDGKLRALVLENQLPLEPGPQTFHFVTRKGKLRRLELTEGQAKLLEEGKLAVVERQDPDKIDHALVPSAVAEQMLVLFPKAVRFFNRPEAPVGFLQEEAEQPEEPSSAEEPSGETFIPVKRAPST
ncbi:MAG: DUF2058 family protein [Myxococcota bacterium]